MGKPLRIILALTAGFTAAMVVANTRAPATIPVDHEPVVIDWTPTTLP